MEVVEELPYRRPRRETTTKSDLEQGENAGWNSETTIKMHHHRHRRLATAAGRNKGRKTDLRTTTGTNREPPWGGEKDGAVT